jgi:hypothetical protein
LSKLRAIEGETKAVLGAPQRDITSWYREIRTPQWARRAKRAVASSALAAFVPALVAFVAVTVAFVPVLVAFVAVTVAFVAVTVAFVPVLVAFVPVLVPVLIAFVRPVVAFVRLVLLGEARREGGASDLVPASVQLGADLPPIVGVAVEATFGIEVVVPIHDDVHAKA